MVYLKKESLETIGETLIKMGDFVDKKPNGETKVLRECIFTIINTLSKELSLGGQIDEDIYDRLEEKLNMCK
jgi:hypothetical protein